MTKVLLLAAGKGERMLPLTAEVPKPLLKVGGSSLIEHHLERLAAAGFEEIVINTAYLGEKIRQQLGDGSNYGLAIEYSVEPRPLESGGGMRTALSKLGVNDYFLVVNADIYTDFDFSMLKARLNILQAAKQSPDCLAHLILVNNPQHNPQGDFQLEDGMLGNIGDDKKTYSGIGIYHPALFAHCQLDTVFSIVPLLREAADKQRVSGELYSGLWSDIGTPERLDAINRQIQGEA